MPVPAGMSLPMMMFSLRPTSVSRLDSMAASVSTRVVSWKEAADSHDSVAREALVIPMTSRRPDAGLPPSRTISRLVCSKTALSTRSSGRKCVSPGSPMATLLVI